MKNKFLNQFILQREMYFSSCYVTKLGNYYFSNLDDLIWNFFVPNSDEFLDEIEIIKDNFLKRKKSFCVVVNSEDKDVLNRCSLNFKPFYFESWLRFVGNKLFDTKLVCDEDINELKSVMFASYVSKNEGIQPWGNLDEKYFDIINEKLENENIRNFALKNNDEIMAVCSLYSELDIYNIFNFAISPKYQNNLDTLEIIKHVSNYFLEQEGKELYIQLETDSNISKYIKKMDFKEDMNVVYLK